VAVTNYTGPVRFTSPGLLNGVTVVQATGGSATTTLSFANAGSWTITATAAYDGRTISVTSSTIAVR
jgi:hypothetical protein